MSLLIAIKTPDGIALAGSPDPEDAAFINQEIFYLATGHHGVIQRVGNELERRHTNNAFLDEADINVIRRKMRSAVRQEILPELEATSVMAKLKGPESSLESATMEAFAAFRLHESVEIIHFDRIGSCTLATGTRPHLVAGPRAQMAEGLLSYFYHLTRTPFEKNLEAAAALACLVYTSVEIVPPRTLLYVQPGQEHPLSITKADTKAVEERGRMWEEAMSEALNNLE